MVKPRPVVVLSPRLERIRRTRFIIGPLSTTCPDPIQEWHLKVELPGKKLPEGFAKECWVKADMIYAVSLERLDF